MAKCDCSFRIRLLGDGCSVCNPQYWRDQAYFALRRRAARLWYESGRKIGRGDCLHSFMVSHPDTQREFMEAARKELET